MANADFAKVMVVYDSATIRDTISLLGTDKWPNLIELAAPEQTLSSIRTEHPEIIILCAMTANSASYELCSQIKTSFPEIPVLIVALQEGEEHTRLSREAGADRALRLSLGSDEMMMHIRSLLDVFRSKARMSSGDTDVIRVPRSSRVLERLSDAERRIDELETIVRKLSKNLD